MLEQLMVNDYSFDSYQQLNDNLQYIDYINQHYDFKEINVNPDIAYRYQGDFFGLLNHLGNVSPSLYLYTLYLNNYTHPTHFNGIIPNTLKIAIKPPIPQN